MVTGCISQNTSQSLRIQVSIRTKGLGQTEQGDNVSIPSYSGQHSYGRRTTGQVLFCVSIPSYSGQHSYEIMQKGNRHGSLNPFVFRSAFVRCSGEQASYDVSLNPFVFRSAFVHAAICAASAELEVSIPSYSGQHSYMTIDVSDQRSLSQSLRIQVSIRTFTPSD